MSISQVVKSKRDGTIKIEDGTSPTPNELTVAFEAGDFNLTIPGPAVVANLDRGVFGSTPSLRYSDDQAMTATFTAYLRDLSDGSYATLEEIILQSGDVGTNWVSTLGGDAEVLTFNVVLTIAGVVHGDSTDHTLTLPHCVITGSLAEGDPDTVSISLTSYANFPTDIT